MRLIIPKKAKPLPTGFLALTPGAEKRLAQGPSGKYFGFGLVIIDLLGTKVIHRINPVNSLISDIGAPDFGPARRDADQPSVRFITMNP